MKVPHGGDIWSIARHAGLDPKEVLDFSASVSPFGPSALAIERIKESINLLGAYPDPLAFEFKEALSAYLCVEAENIAVGNGSIELIYLLPRLLRPKRALIVEPAFGEYRRSLELVECEVESFVCKEENGFALDTQALIERLREGPGFDLLYMANPANPTGALTPVAEIARVLKACEAQGTIFVVDEAFCDFVEQASVKSFVRNSDSLIVFRSMTKFFSLAGLRLGAMFASTELIDRIGEESTPWSVNTLAMAAGLGSLMDADYIKEVRAWFSEEHDFMAGELSSIDGLSVFPSSANFFMLKADGPGEIVSHLRDKLLKEKIVIRSLAEFRALGETFFRVAIRKREDNVVLVETMKAILGDLTAL